MKKEKRNENRMWIVKERKKESGERKRKSEERGERKENG